VAIEVGDAIWRIKGDTSALDASTEKSSAKIQREFEKAAAAAERAAEKAAAAQERVAQKAIAAAEKAAAAAERASMREQVAAEKSAAAQARAAERAAAAAVAAAEKAHRAYISNLNSLSSNLQQVGSSIRTVGYTMTAMGVGITGALGYAVKASMDWETAFTGVRKTVEGTPEQMKALADGIRAMSLEIPVAATELAHFAEIGGQMGVPREQILAFTKVIAILGTTTNISGEEGAAMLAKFANVAQVPQSQYSNLAASIVALGNAGSATESEILAMAQRLSSAGTIAGLTAGDILGISNSLVGVGIEAEAGGTAFSKLFIDMKNATMTGGQQLEMLAAVAGMTAQQFAESFNKDPAQAISSFVQGLQSIEQQGGNVFMVMDALGYTEVRMRNALLSSAQAADTLTGSISLGNSAFKENNAHTAEAAKRFETGDSQAQIMKNTFIELATTIGEALRPTTDALMASITEVVKSMTEWIKAHPELTAMIVKATAVLGAILVVMGTVAIAIGAVIAAVAGAVAAFAALAESTVAVVFAAIATAIVGAIGWIVSAAIGLAAYWDQVVGALKSTWGWMADTFWSIFGPILDAIQAMTGWGIGPGTVSGGGGVGMATGGTVQQSGWAVVGERGPELVQMPRGATVYDAQQSAPVVQGGGTTNSQNVTVNFNRDSVRSDDDIRQIERALTRLIGSGMTANGTRAFA